MSWKVMSRRHRDHAEMFHLLEFLEKMNFIKNDGKNYLKFCIFNSFRNKMKNFLPNLSIKQLKSVMRFLKKCATSKYSHDTDKRDYILEQIDRFFQFRIQSFTSMDVLAVMKTIARHFCFVSDFTEFSLCTWDELVRRVFFVVPSIRIVNKKRLCFRYKMTVFVVHPSYYVYGYRNEDRHLTFNITIIE